MFDSHRLLWGVMLAALAVASPQSVWSQDETCFTCAAAAAPRWYGSAELLWMDRGTPQSSLLMQNASNVNENLNANDFAFDWQPGLAVSLKRRFWDDSEYEFRYFDLGRFDESTVVPTSAANLRINTSPPIFVPNVNEIRARLTSDLRGFEANYHHAIHDEYLVLLGFRYLSLDEDLFADLNMNPQTVEFQASTRNDLYGAQVGVRGTILRGLFDCIPIWGSAKVGVFGNDAEYQGRVATAAANLAIDDSADTVAFAGEIGVAGKWHCRRYVTVHGGYSMLWLENVAIATDQVFASDFLGATGSDDRGHAIFHGARFGVELHL